MSSRSWKLSTAAACMLAAFTLSARVANAQECGDADNSGSVTVTDGVQALRAAAGLSSTCAGSTCDVDGSGSVTVTDGVNILRKAAGIVIAEACGPAGQVQQLLRNTLPIFGSLTKGAGGASAAGTSGCDNPDGQIFFDPDLNEFEFDTCDIGGIEFDGFLSLDASSNTLSFDIDFLDLATDQSFSFFGDLTETAAGQNSIFTGALDVSFDTLGDLTVTFENVLSDPDGNFVDGSLLFDASAADITDVSAVRVGFLRTGTTLPVDVFLTDESQLNFTFDLNSGVLTPAT